MTKHKLLTGQTLIDDLLRLGKSLGYAVRSESPTSAKDRSPAPRSCHYLDSIYPEVNIDDSESRERIKMIHLLARYGAKWKPSGGREINEARRSLLKMKPD